jgi:hypothetical protein
MEAWRHGGMEAMLVGVRHATPIKKLNAVTANTPICRQLNTEDV